MQPDEQAHADTRGSESLLCPPYWLVHAHLWPGGEIAEGAIAYAPITIPREDLSRDAQQILGCADLIADRRHERVVLFSDITRLLAVGDTSWQQLRVDLEHGLRELGQSRFPAMFLTITERAYELICNPALHTLLGVTGGGTLRPRDEERQLVRTVLARRLESDWVPFMRGVVEASRR